MSLTPALIRRKLKAYKRLFAPRWRAAKFRLLSAFMWFVPGESQRVFILTLVIGALCGIAAVSFHLAIIWAESLMIQPALDAAQRGGFLAAILVPSLGGLVSGILLYFAS